MLIKSSKFLSGIKYASSHFRDFIYPNFCLICGAAGEQDLDLCTSCYKNLPWNRLACQRCALPLKSTDASICGACSQREIHYEKTIAPFQFEDFIREAIYQFKFNQKLNHGKLLAQLLLQHIETKEIEIPDIIIPVPLHKKRLQQRGYNQALEIARIISKTLSCDISYQSVFRNRDTSAQMDLPAKQRHKNVKDAFDLKHDSNFLKNKHICILDDVMTTGNTVNEVAKCVQKTGTNRIDIWCVARVA